MDVHAHSTLQYAFPTPFPQAPLHIRILCRLLRQSSMCCGRCYIKQYPLHSNHAGPYPQPTSLQALMTGSRPPEEAPDKAQDATPQIGPNPYTEFISQEVRAVLVQKCGVYY